MFCYTATKGRECIKCSFDSFAEMQATMMRHIHAGYSVTGGK